MTQLKIRKALKRVFCIANPPPESDFGLVIFFFRAIGCIYERRPDVPYQAFGRLSFGARAPEGGGFD